MDDTMRKILARLPLGEAVLWLWRWVADETFLEQLYEQERGRSYERVLRFSTLVYLVADALLKHDGSARQSFERAEEAETLSASIQAAYGKLRRIPIELSQAFLAACTDRLRTVFPEKVCTPLPTSLVGFEVLVVDGKTIKRLAKRLKVLRGLSAGALGGEGLGSPVGQHRAGLGASGPSRWARE